MSGAKAPINDTPLLRERFWAKVEKTESCWLWTGALVGNGYGIFSIGLQPQVMRMAHRVAYEFVHGTVPSDLVVNHLCREPRCVRIDHLEATTQRANLRYSDQALGVRSGRTQCPRGHEYTADNVIAYRGSRKCKTCHRERERIRRASTSKGKVVAA